VEGDPEACGGIAVLALGLVKVRGTPLAKADLEGAAIRSAIERPRAGDPGFAQAVESFERAERRQERKPSAGRREEPAAKAAPREPVLDDFAKASGISSRQLSAELGELRRNARDPAKVRQPADARFDAELSTSANGKHAIFDRERVRSGHEGEPRAWCRYSSPGRCGLRVDPEIDKFVDEALKESEGPAARRPPSQPEKPLTRAEYERRKAAADEAFKFGDEPGQISAEVGRHKDAPAIREAEGLSGKQVQSAHDAPSSFMKTLDDYSRDNAITMLLERGEHRSFDQIWKDWAQDQRRLGRTEVTVRELHDVMADAIERAPIKDGQKSALIIVLHDELFQKHGLSPTRKLPLPYSNVPALKPGPELTALRASTAAAGRARATTKPRTAAREQAHIQKTIETLENAARSLERSGNKSGAQVYRLQIEKLKRRQRN
jgi:hypothetical protein